MHRSKCLISVIALICFEAYYFKRLFAMFTDGKPDLVILLLVTEPVAALRRYKHCLPTPLFTYQLSLIYRIAVYRKQKPWF